MAKYQAQEEAKTINHPKFNGKTCPYDFKSGIFSIPRTIERAIIRPRTQGPITPFMEKPLLLYCNECNRECEKECAEEVGIRLDIEYWRVDPFYGNSSRFTHIPHGTSFGNYLDKYLDTIITYKTKLARMLDEQKKH